MQRDIPTLRELTGQAGDQQYMDLQISTWKMSGSDSCNEEKQHKARRWRDSGVAAISERPGRSLEVTLQRGLHETSFVCLGEKNVPGRGSNKAESQQGTAGCVHARTGGRDAGDKGKGGGLWRG